MILSVCVASATFCARLERRALQESTPPGMPEGHNTRQPEPEYPSRRLRATVSSPIAATRMENYLKSKGMGQTDFAATVGTTDRTLRSFRKTGRVRRDILDSIAKHMGTTKEALLRLE
jgi:DNA-binding Xre family transcriptional regulator